MEAVKKSIVTHPNHYEMPIQPLTFIIQNGLGFCEGNIIKYVCRYKHKGGLGDLQKARTYLDELINKESGCAAT